MYNGLVRQADPAISCNRVGIDIGSCILWATSFFSSRFHLLTGLAH